MGTKKKIVSSLLQLNAKQKKAVIAEEKRVLVLAGAGSGKTKTLLQKIMYLIQEKGVHPSEIMAITFTKNAANEMVDRLLLAVDTEGNYQKSLENKSITKSALNIIRLQKSRENKWISKLTVRTFHSLCYSIMKSYGAKEFDNKFKLLTDGAEKGSGMMKRISAEESQYDVLHKMLITCCEDREFLLSFKRYVIDYLVDRIHIDSRVAIAEYPNGKFYTSLKGEKVRSKSEQYICDWLYRHNISYQYEPKVDFDGYQFRPDFFIPDANMYIEHVSNVSSPSSYKEQAFKDGGRTLVKTYEAMTHDSSLFNETLTRIVKGKLPATFLTETILSYEEEMKSRHKEIRDFLRQVLRVMDMCQVDEIKLDKLKLKIKKEKHERVRLFYRCAIPIIEKYQDYCTNKSYLDFNQLINTCIDLINKHDDIREIMHGQYKYVLVDEFQDVNSIQVRMIKTMMNPEAQLFCVGDDWQSIYGFRGSDVSYIVEFNRYFKDAKIVQLNHNYRSTDFIVKASNEVISHNSFKIEKQIKSVNKSKKKIEVYAGIDHVDSVNFCVQEVQELLDKGIDAGEILFLYRRSKMFNSYKKAFQKHKLHVNGKTIHAAKGLEAQVVFIIGMTDGYGGFPDIWMEDRIYQIIKPVNFDLLLEEERRLFYVAITRARRNLYLITELGVESSFIKEIPDNFKAVYSTPLKTGLNHLEKCTQCGTTVEKYYKFCPFCGGVVG